MDIVLIAACSENRVIGKNNSLLWHLPDDLKHFKQTTLGSSIVMGRKTFESIGFKPLPNRKNVIMTKLGLNIDKQNIILASSKEDVLNKTKDQSRIFIVGGEMIYKLFLKDATHIFLTLVHHKFEGDTYFPCFENDRKWKLTAKEFHKKDKFHKFDYTYKWYEKVN